MGKGIRFTVWRNDTLFGNENENTDVGGKNNHGKVRQDSSSLFTVSIIC